MASEPRSGGQSETARPSFTHAGILVYDAERLARFYHDVLELHETDRGVGSRGYLTIFMSSDVAHHHQFVLVQARAPGQPSTVGQLSFLLSSLDGLRRVHRRVVERGEQPTRIVDHGTSWSVYLADPEDNTVEAYVTSPWYINQPHAEPLDLGQSDAEICSTTERRCRADPSFMMMSEWQERTRRAWSTETTGV